MRLSGRLLCGVTLLAFAACVGQTEPVDVVKWQGFLIASVDTGDPFTGLAAMVIEEQQTRMGISVDDAPAGITIGWAVLEGSCDAPGERVGPATAYPPVDVSESGTGAAETVLFRRISTTGPYATLVYENRDGSGRVLACADLEEQL